MIQSIRKTRFLRCILIHQRPDPFRFKSCTFLNPIYLLVPSFGNERLYLLTAYGLHIFVLFAEKINRTNLCGEVYRDMNGLGCIAWDVLKRCILYLFVDDFFMFKIGFDVNSEDLNWFHVSREVLFIATYSIIFY